MGMSKPPGYRLTKPRPSKLEPFLSVIHEILDNDRTVHRKQRHTAQRIFDRLRDEAECAAGDSHIEHDRPPVLSDAFVKRPAHPSSTHTGRLNEPVEPDGKRIAH